MATITKPAGREPRSGLARVNYPQEADESHLRPLSSCDAFRISARSYGGSQSVVFSQRCTQVGHSTPFCQGRSHPIHWNQHARRATPERTPRENPHPYCPHWLLRCLDRHPGFAQSPRQIPENAAPPFSKTALQGVSLQESPRASAPCGRDSAKRPCLPLQHPRIVEYDAEPPGDSTSSGCSHHHVQGEVRVKLRPDIAPATVWNFVRLAESTTSTTSLSTESFPTS